MNHDRELVEAVEKLVAVSRERLAVEREILCALWRIGDRLPRFRQLKTQQILFGFAEVKLKEGECKKDVS